MLQKLESWNFSAEYWHKQTGRRLRLSRYGYGVTSWNHARVPCWWLPAAVGCKQAHPSVRYKWLRNFTCYLSCRLTTSLVSGASRLLVPNCGTTFHSNYGSQTCLSRCSDGHLRCYCSTTVPSDFSFSFFNALAKYSFIYVCMYMYVEENDAGQTVSNNDSYRVGKNVCFGR